MVPILKVIRQPSDNLDDYRQEFGYLGLALQVSVSRSGGSPAPASSTLSSSGNSA